MACPHTVNNAPRCRKHIRLLHAVPECNVCEPAREYRVCESATLMLARAMYELNSFNGNYAAELYAQVRTFCPDAADEQLDAALALGIKLGRFMRLPACVLCNPCDPVQVDKFTVAPGMDADRRNRLLVQYLVHLTGGPGAPAFYRWFTETQSCVRDAFSTYN